MLRLKEKSTALFATVMTQNAGDTMLRTNNKKPNFKQQHQPKLQQHPTVTNPTAITTTNN